MTRSKRRDSLNASASFPIRKVNFKYVVICPSHVRSSNTFSLIACGIDWDTKWFLMKLSTFTSKLEEMSVCGASLSHPDTDTQKWRRHRQFYQCEVYSCVFLSSFWWWYLSNAFNRMTIHCTFRCQLAPPSRTASAEFSLFGSPARENDSVFLVEQQ